MIVDCVFTDNAANAGGAIRCTTTDTIIRNSLIHGNSADRGTGGGIVFGTVENCTVIHNRARTSGGTYLSTVRNSIVYHNEARFSSGDNYTGGTFSYSCTTPDPGGTGNITADPQLEPGGEPRPMPGSPCIDAGSDDLWLGGDRDLAGNPRQSGAGIDMGAYEFQAATLDCGFIVDAPSGIVPHEVTFTAFTNGIDAAGLTYYWDFENSGTWDQQGTDKQIVTHTYTVPGLYTVRLTISNSVPETVTRIRDDYVCVPAADLYVSASGTGVPPYTNWVNAAQTIREAVDMSVDGCTIWVADGSYGEHVRVKKGITLSSTNGYAGALLNEASWWPVSVNHSNAVVRGFTIAGVRHGVWHYAGLVDGCRITGHTSNANNDQAGGMRIFVGAVVANSIFDGNSMANVNNNGAGGGIYAEGGLITHCVLTNNNANNGAAIFVSGTGTIIRNSLIHGNSATSNGGGVHGGTVASCTIVGNTSATGGGTRNSIVINSIVYGNTATSGDNYSGGTFTYSLTTPLPVGTGNIDADPLFVDAPGGDFRLQVKPVVSPAIDAGLDQGWMTNATDLDGNPRLQNKAVDMGAYEMEVRLSGSLFLLR